MRALRKLRASDRTDRPPTAEEIRTARFGQSPMAWRGYSEEEVGVFLARVAAGVETAEAERVALRAEVDRLRNFYRSHGTEVNQVPVVPGNRPAAAGGDLPSQVRQWLDAFTANAERYADLLTGGLHRPPEAPPARDEARDLLVHCEVVGRISFDELLDGFRSAYATQPAAVDAELRRTQVWLEEFSAALTRQLSALHTVIADRLPDTPDGGEGPDGPR